MAPEKADQQQVRRHNLAFVLEVLAREGARSRAELAERTGLTKATVSTLVGELLDRALAAEQGRPDGPRRGRPATLVGVHERLVSLGLEIDVDEVGVAAVDLRGRVVASARRPVDNADARPGTAVARVARLADPFVADLRAAGHTVAAATLAVPGLVTPDGARVVVAPNLGWRDEALGARAGRRLEQVVVLANEAELAARAELTLGAGRDLRHLLVVSAGVGIGAGVVVDGRVFRGAHGFGGELGHFVVERGGRPCPCGNRGCLERYVGRRDLPAVLRPRAGDRDWPATVVAAAQEGAGPVLTALDEVGGRLAQALVAAVQLFDPEAVVLGGWLAPLAPWLTPVVARELDRHVLGARWARCEVRAAELGGDAPLLGAALAGVERALADPLALP